MHIHDWNWHRQDEKWTCNCGITITLREFTKEYGQMGNLDVDVTAGLNKLASKRKGDAHTPDFR